MLHIRIFPEKPQHRRTDPAVAGRVHAFVCVLRGKLSRPVNRFVGRNHRILNHRQGPKAQKVHLQQTQPLDGRHGELRGGGPVGRPRERHQILRRLRTDDYAGRVHRGVPRQTLEPAAHVDHLFYPLVALVRLPQIRVHPQRLVERHSQLVRNHPRDGINKAVRQVHDAPHVPNHTLRLQGAERDDLHNTVRPVLPGHIVNDLASPLVCKIHVDIRHGDALRIEKPLEDEVVLHRVEIRDMKAVGDDRPRGGSTAGSDADAVLPRIVDVIPYNKEVIDIPHLSDHAELILEPLPHPAALRGIVRVPLRHALLAETVQICPGIIPLRHVKPRQLCFAELNRHMAAVRDLLRVFNGLRRIGEQPGHLLPALDIELPARIAHPVLVGQLLPGLNA